MVVMLQTIFAFAWWMAYRIRSTEVEMTFGFFSFNLLMSFALLLIAVRSVYPGVWHKVLPLSLICVANFLMIRAAHAFFRIRLRWWVAAAPLLIGVIGIFAFVFVRFSDTHRIAVFLISVLVACTIATKSVATAFIKEFGVFPIAVLVGTLSILAVPIIWASYLGLFTEHPIGLWETTRLNDIAMFGLAFAITGPNLMFAAIVAIRSVNERKLSERRDSLTTLLNHQAFMTICERDWRDRRDRGSLAAAIAIDLDDFKRVNDRYGHHVGDHVLVTFSNILREVNQPLPIVARAGGGEFFALLSPGTPQSARAMAQQLRAAMLNTRWTTLIGGPSRVTVSVGIAWDESTDTKFNDVWMRAEHALQIAKSNGRDRLVLFDGTVDAR
jgi:diguanylate cyclase (GGDEF)-like protein